MALSHPRHLSDCLCRHLRRPSRTAQLSFTGQKPSCRWRLASSSPDPVWPSVSTSPNVLDGIICLGLRANHDDVIKIINFLHATVVLLALVLHACMTIVQADAHAVGQTPLEDACDSGDASCSRTQRTQLDAVSTRFRATDRRNCGAKSWRALTMYRSIRQ